MIFLGFKVMTYAENPEKVKLFYKGYAECAKELGLPACEYYIYRCDI